MDWDLVIIFTFVIVLTAVRAHYRGRGATAVGLASADQVAIDRAMEVARRLEQRVETLERLLDEDAPGWAREGTRMTALVSIRRASRPAPAILLLAGLLAAAHAHAETRTISGANLVLSTSTPNDVAIDTDLSLHGEVRISMDAGLSCVSAQAGYAVTIATSRCNDDSGRLRIDVSPDAAVTIAASGDGDVHVADLNGPLTATLSGSGDLIAGRTGALILAVHASGDASLGDINGPATLDMNGNGNVKIKAIHGPLTVRQVGTGDLAAGAIQADRVVIESNGSGDILLGGGHIEMLQAHLNGSGDLSVAATAHDATVDVRGGGDVKLGPVSGTLNQAASDGSEITVLDAQHARAIDDQAARKFGGVRNHGTVRFDIQTRGVVENLLTAAFVGLVLYICWRIVRRAGGLPGMRRQFRNGAPAAPTNPGVLALGETMTRLEQRLGRLESYVTTREFDLTRKFRELGPQ